MPAARMLLVFRHHNSTQQNKAANCAIRHCNVSLLSWKQLFKCRFFRVNNCLNSVLVGMVHIPMNYFIQVSVARTGFSIPVGRFPKCNLFSRPKENILGLKMISKMVKNHPTPYADTILGNYFSLHSAIHGGLHDIASL